MSRVATIFNQGLAFFHWVFSMETLAGEPAAGPAAGRLSWLKWMAAREELGQDDPAPGPKTLVRWLVEREELGRDEPLPAEPGTGPIIHLLRRDVLTREEDVPNRITGIRWLLSSEELGREDEIPGSGPPLLAWLISRDHLESSDPKTPGQEKK